MITHHTDFSIKNQGLFLDMPYIQYHNDPCPNPSLSNSLIRDLIDKSPLHAAYKHPRIFKQHQKESTSSMVRGAVLHKIILKQGLDLEIIYADDYRTKKAKEQKELAITEQRIPVLEKDFHEISRCAEIAIEKMKKHPECEGFFTDGISEAVIAWQENDIWCRSMIDRLPQETHYPIFDLKGTDYSASPLEWSSRLSKFYRTQGIFYNRGIQKIQNSPKRSMRFIVIEMYEPFEISIFALSPELEEIANLEVDYAIKLWSHCLKTGEWKGYPQSTNFVEPSTFLYKQIIDQQITKKHDLYY